MKYSIHKSLHGLLLLVILLNLWSEDGNAAFVDPTQNNQWYAENYKCPDGWVQRCEKCYLLVEQEKTWTDARYNCKQQGGDLVTIKDFETNMFITRYSQHKSESARVAWIGLHDRNIEGKFEWISGAKAVQQEMRWLPGEPQNSAPGEDCVEIYVRTHQYLWNDAPCSDELPSICQIDGCVKGTNRCDNGKCISKTQFCDGIDQCGDNSDERNCSTSCGGYFYGTGGNFTSPNYPNPYGNFRDCSWIIEVPKGKKVQLKFHRFNVEEGFDFVQVFDGRTLASTSFGRFNGNKLPKVLYSTSNEMRVLLKSDESDSMSGFYVEYKAVDDVCGYKEITIPKGGEHYFNSPSYPDNYWDESKCIWQFKNSDPLKILTLIIFDLDSEKDNDFLEVRDGTEDGYVLGRYSGKTSQMIIHFSSKEKLFVKFQSDHQNNRKGFRAVVREGCYAELKVSQGIISSPGFGYRKYPNLLRCTWKIREPNDLAVSLMFHKFDTERKYDAMTVRRTDGYYLATYSGQKTKGYGGKYSWILETDQADLDITFKTDVTYEMNGFNLTFSIDCPSLPNNIVGGTIIGKNHYGAEVMYTCDKYHTLKNGQNRTCEYGGVWSKPEPYCQEIDCGHPGLVKDGGFIANGAKVNGSFSRATVLNYYCNAGFKLVGNEERICEKGGVWSGTQPKCVVNVCPHPGTPLHGMVKIDELNVGSVVEYSCRSGYKLVGEGKIKCNEGGKWSAPTPSCEKIFCNVPKAPLNGKFVVLPVFPENATVLPYGTKMAVQCNVGFKRIGDEVVKCTDESTWKPDVATCVDIDECMTSNPCPGVGSKCINTKGSYQCVCKKGYKQTTTNTCEDIDECFASNRTVKCNQICTNLPGSYKCSCEDGYFLYNGDNTTLTRVELKTAIKDHTCFGKMCPLPTIPAHGYVINYGNRHPVVLDYRCEGGYVRKGSRYVKCLANQKWDNSFPTCQLAECHEPSVIPNGVYSVNGTKHINKTTYKVLTWVEYNCNHGYERTQGNLLRECTQNRTYAFWSGTEPTCGRKSCGALLIPKNGQVSSTGTKFGDIATYKCNGGYEIKGNAQRTCGADGKWSGGEPVCAASPCPDPGIPTRGWRQGIIALGETVTYGCLNEGFELQGAKNSTCIYMKDKGGNFWTKPLPICVDTMKPVFNCSSSISYELPRGENRMLVNWTIPEVTDNSGNQVVLTAVPNITPPSYLNAGKNNIIYTATDKTGNQVQCTVIVDIQDKEKPRIKCPTNIVIKNDLPVKVTYGQVVTSDNTAIQSITYDPPSGTVFQSNRHHRVEATVVDVQGNRDTCVFEVYVKGCGCTQRECPDYKPKNGISKCHINDLGLGHIISCNVMCPKGWDFVDKHFTGGETENHKCDPKTGWPEKYIPGCAPRIDVQSCYNTEIIVKYNNTIPKEIVNDVNALKNIAQSLYTKLQTVNQFCANGYVNFEHQSINVSDTNNAVKFAFKISTVDSIERKYIKQILPVCVQAIEDKLLKTSVTDILQTVSVVKDSMFAETVGIKLESCCNTTDHWCCPVGSKIRSHTTVLAGAKCYGCTPGMFLNETVNKCLNCPIGTFTTTTGGNTQCKQCPNGQSTLKEQSTGCIDLCSPGSFSSTGLSPTCRKCDYGEYQSSLGSKQCIKCPDGTTTFERGAKDINACKAPCLAGEYSTSGLQPCMKCPRDTYQNEAGRSTCKQCQSGGIYGGKEGATSEKECPTTNPCDQKLCQNSVQCIPGNYTFECVCKPGWTGKLCKTDIDECASSPCGNHGNCADLINDYNCTCIKGITGRNCEKNIDDCKNNTCLNSGVCQDLINDFYCACPKGYSGKRCETDIDECSPMPCLNNATCENFINDFKCNCQPGWEGKRCEKNIDECLPKPCLNNATCIDKLNGVQCNCQPGFTGKFCGTDIDECVGQPCQNNATCVDLVNAYRCECRPGYTGFNCSVEIDECDPNPCLQNSTCEDLVNKFKCHCEAGYYGDRCEFEKNECESRPCQNNATCVDKVNDFHCVCPLGYTGKQCETNIIYLYVTFSRNKGTSQDVDVKNQVNDFHCVCPLGYTGKQCETNINECEPNPCQNGATCHDLVGDYRCTCAKGYTGRNCSTIIDNCQSSPCVNNGTCTNQIGDFTCKCVAGYTGKTCDVDINECKPDPCNGNAVSCSDLINDFVCFCKPQYRGKNCSILIDNCTPHPCLYNGTCKNIYVTNDFQCTCKPGYYGKRCENETNECDVYKPCQNGANCTDLIADYKCACPIGFTGKNCSTNIDDCKNITCLNGGKCEDLINNYQCNCPATHKGRHCEKKIPNEVDIKLPGGEESFIKHSNISAIDELTLSFWFRSTSQKATGTLVTLLHNKKPYPKAFMSMKGNEVTFTIAGKELVIVMRPDLDNKYWHHMFLFMSGLTGKIQLVLDDKVIMDELEPELVGKRFFDPNGIIVLGKQVNKTGSLIDDGFKGEISQFALWDRELNNVEIASLSGNCTVLNGSIIPWVGLLEGAGKHVQLLEKWSCGKNICPADFTGRFCEVEIDKISPVVVSCPSSKKVITANSTTRVYWKEPVFTDDKGVVHIVRSHAPGQIFTWGHYVISYIAYDDFKNSATCTFELYISPFDCPKLSPSANSKDACGIWKWGRFCDMQCNTNYELAVPKPPFFSCGRMGTWSHGPPTYPENPDNLLPACSATTKPAFSGQNKITYPTTHCENLEFRKNFTEKFKKLIQSVHETWKICGDTCNFDSIRVRCTGSTRERRDLSNVNEEAAIEIIFDSFTVTKQDENLAENLRLGVKDYSIDMSLNVDGVKLDIDNNNTLVGEKVEACGNGSILKKNACVACPIGTFKNKTIEKCEACPVGTYSNKSGSQACVKCSDGKTTIGNAKTSTSHCIVPCKAGEYYEKITKHCLPCPIGFYNPTALSTCLACPLGTTTKEMGSKPLSACSVTCPLGHEMINSECVPCMFGYYRNNASQSECVACSYDKTIYKRGSTDGKCLAKCSVGYELNNNGTVCMPCATGYYKDHEHRPMCTKCAGKEVTRGYASTNRSQCFEPVSSTLYDVTLSFTSLTWQQQMTDKNSVEFRRIAHALSKSILSVYKGSNNINSVVVNELKNGSIVASMTFSFLSTLNDPIKVLRDEVTKGNVDGYEVDKKSFTTDRCSHFNCPVDQFCWYNQTGAGCRCKDGYYQSNDGQRCYVKCESGYCMNNGVCQESSNKGRTCICESDYSGERCETKENKHNIALIVGLTIGALALAFLIFCCLRQRQRRGGKDLKRLNEVDVDEPLNMENIKTTPIVVHIEKKKPSTRQPDENEVKSLAFENKAADLTDGESTIERTESTKVNVVLKGTEVEMNSVPLNDGNNDHMTLI